MLARLSRSELLAAISGDALLLRVLNHVKNAADEDPAHDVEHLLRVAACTLALAAEQATLRECVCAALLHDVVNVPKNHAERARASTYSATAAREFLQQDLPAESLTRVVEAIEDHSFSAGRRPRSALGEALQDADRLEALGALGLARTFSTGARMGARYFDPEDPWALGRSLADTRFSVDHFFSKLLTLAPTLCTEAGRREAEHRAELLRTFLLALADEIGCPLELGKLPERA